MRLAGSKFPKNDLNARVPEAVYVEPAAAEGPGATKRVSVTYIAGARERAGGRAAGRLTRDARLDAFLYTDIQNIQCGWRHGITGTEAAARGGPGRRHTEILPHVQKGHPKNKEELCDFHVKYRAI